MSITWRVLAFVLVAMCVPASCAYAYGQMISITDQAYASFIGFEFAVDDGQGGVAWVSPATTDFGSFGVYAINNDPIDRTVPGTAAGKLRTNPEGQWPYETPGPHYAGPFFVGDYYGLAAGVGPEYIGNWVGIRVGSDTTQLIGARFSMSASFNPDELRVEMWTMGMGVTPTLLTQFQPQGFTQYDMRFDGGNMLELRMIVGPKVPEPSSAVTLLPGLALLCLRRLRFTG